MELSLCMGGATLWVPIYIYPRSPTGEAGCPTQNALLGDLAHRQMVRFLNSRTTLLTISSQADVLGVASSVAQLLEGAIRLLKRVRKAYERHQNLAEVLDKHALEIENINAIVRAIVDEDALQTAVVTSELEKLHAIGAKLVNCLEELDPRNKGKVRQLAHQLVHGTKEEETLADIMRSLDRAKADLSLRVQLANVGLTRMVHDTVLANVEVISLIDRLLAEVFRESHGLKLAGLLKDMVLQGSCI
jgi:hypothetical protein